MIVDRYYYQQLNKKEQEIYKIFYNGIMAHEEIIPIPIHGEFSSNSFERIFTAITKDNPLIYFLNQSACSMAKDIFGHIAICPQYFFTKEKVKEYNRKIEQVVNDIVGQLNLLKCSDYEKELQIHDWICKNIKYDYEGSDKSKLSRVIASHNILGVFAYHKAQCEGIAKAVKVLLNAVDERCIVVTGDTIKDRENVPHAWNIVNIGGEPYHLDVTWDIGSTEKDKQYLAHDYFNLPDDLIKQDHKAHKELPNCKAKTANYYVKNRCVFSTRCGLMMYIDRLLVQKVKVFEFRADGRLNKSILDKEISDYILHKLKGQGRNRVGIRTYVNRKIGVHRIEIH